ncbi:RNA 2',3'-cyclic phosphodiesterase [Janthinobacterium lividum]|uniref:RNA 2',3'-cyclic phosphodiesterase n=1 Tax=Janthinobacterium lividum TaxID=29581 RepID=A0ABU0XU41_9BURK|nr:RNA 2',3'-cyclic phosphodiesterase [Janthinobacterium lividum]MDQ4626623.1 RNA 2',3'-cyclic phosphodiesterase [Janthinobacterium lividum]MDQ4674410.1 RNA 2',3'-cyclic phosphodiesterase [Janthinobacterium lividum]MDQ4685141.1 RNA 2',3'-cyclic phosphodiesterase [Janthinobacterium lividum]
MSPDTHCPRLFYALWPDAATRAALAAWQARLDGKPVRPDKLHLTLAFLGQRPASELPALLDILAHLPARPMPLLFDHASHFPKLALAWAALAQPSPALLDLRAACMHGLMEQGLAPRFEHDRFTPHVTLARQAPPPASQDFAPIAWQADELVLVESFKSSGDYRILASRKLT